jgi:hypothetical protein
MRQEHGTPSVSIQISGEGYIPRRRIHHVYLDRISTPVNQWHFMVKAIETGYHTI